MFSLFQNRIPYRTGLIETDRIHKQVVSDIIFYGFLYYFSTDKLRFPVSKVLNRFWRILMAREFKTRRTFFTRCHGVRQKNLSELRQSLAWSIVARALLGGCCTFSNILNRCDLWTYWTFDCSFYISFWYLILFILNLLLFLK